MGRPLWVEPTKKSTPSETPSETPSDVAAQSRSSIRRQSSPRRSAADRRQHLRDTRGARLRLLLAAHPDAFDSAWFGPRSLRTDEFREARNALPPHPSMPLQYNASPSLQVPDIVVPAEWPHAMPDPRTNEEDPFSQDPAFMRNFTERMVAEAVAEEAERAGGLAAGPDGIGGLAVAESARRFEAAIEASIARDSRLGEALRPAQTMARTTSFDVPTTQTLPSVRRIPARNVDGLGDRDRSPTPEQDAAWNTLQSTLTPDPQPPSAGSSFARVEEPEPPCDPFNELDLDEREFYSQIPWDSLDHGRRIPPSRRSYADVLRNTSNTLPSEVAEDPEWLAGMHRIVRGLASRQDIPDEWWAQAGLTRSMSWEEEN